MNPPVLAPETAQLVHLGLEWLGMALGFQVYRRQRARAGGAGVLAPGTYGVLLGCILGAALGNKLVFWIEFPHMWANHGFRLAAWMSGQSIVGGLLGGLLGVEIAKKLTGVTRSTGDDFILPLMVGTVIGRIGCFLAGLNDGTYGVATTLPWGIDFGDGVTRHPTQLYDIAFVLSWGSGVLALRPRWRTRPGLAFKVYLAGYLAWRLAIDSIKPLHFDYGWGLGGIQLVCLVALLCYLPLLLKQLMEPLREALPVQ